MVRAIQLMVVFFLSLNLFTGVLIGTGVGEDIGLGGQVAVGGDEKVDTVQDETSEVNTGAPTGSTLFGMYNVLSGTLGTISTIAFGGPAMLNNAGVPSALTDMLKIIIGVVYAIGIIKFLRGI